MYYAGGINEKPYLPTPEEQIKRTIPWSGPGGQRQFDDWLNDLTNDLRQPDPDEDDHKTLGRLFGHPADDTQPDLDPGTDPDGMRHLARRLFTTTKEH